MQAKRKHVDTADSTFGIENFVSETEVDRMNLRCGICLDVVHKAVSPACGHCICETCHRKDISRCPTCNGEGGVFPNGFVDRLVMELKTKCLHCGLWTGALRDLQNKHWNECTQRMDCCALCDTAMVAADLQNHTKNECPKRIVQCAQCDSSHSLGKCPNTPDQCVDCKAAVLIKDRPTHLCRCEHCDKAIPLDIMQAHWTICTMCMPCVQPKCKKFVSKQKIEQHVRERHDGETLPCSICRKAFSDISKLQLHVLTEHFRNSDPLEIRDNLATMLRTRSSGETRAISFLTAHPDSATDKVLCEVSSFRRTYRPLMFAQDVYGDGAIHWAAYLGFSRLTLRLLCLGANARDVGGNGWTPLQNAQASHSVHTVDVVRQFLQ